MINYAAKARKAYLINNFDKILNSLNTLHSTVETMTLFVNDQAYNYILKLKEVIKTSPMYKHNIKRLLNDMDKEIKRYNASIYYINKERSEVIADITQAMEDCLMPYIDDLAGAIRAAVWSRGVSEERTEAAVLSLIVSSLATPPARSISRATSWPMSLRWTWPGTNWVKELAMAMIGFLKSASFIPVARHKARAPALLRPWVEVFER